MIERVLGSGGMGVVYEATQSSLERRVALKIMRPEIARDPAFVDRFAATVWPVAERRGNRTTEELRRELRELTPEQRFERQLAMSRTALRLRDAGRASRR